MDAATRDRLVERRRMLGLRRRRHEISASFRRVAPVLCAAGVRPVKMMPVQIARVLGSLGSGPGEDEELDLSWAAGFERSTWSSPEQRDTLCRWALSAVAHEHEEVAVIWHPVRAAARVSVAAVRSHTKLLLDEGKGDTIWLVSANGNSWLIQIGYWSSTISYAADASGGPLTA
jgi:hypothetical protein